MIRKLILTGFGKFRRAEFDLSGVTLVYGPNEAGKTTFFDGLFQALCRPSETKQTGKVLKCRYGAGRGAEAVLADAPTAGEGGGAAITDEEFMNLYAIREGDLKLEFDKGTKWLDKLKSRLFHGGLDPSLLAAEFAKRSSDSRTLTHNRELEKAKEAAGEAREELGRKRQEREAVLARENSVAEAERELREIRERLQAWVHEAGELDARAAEEDKIAQRHKWSGQLAKLEEWEGLAAASLAAAPFREDGREEINRLAEAARKAAAAIQAEQGKRDHQAELVAQAKAEALGLRDCKNAAAPRSEAAKRLADQARAAMAGKPAGGLPAWSFIAAGLAVTAGLFGAVKGSGSLTMLLPAAGLLLAIAALVAGARLRGRKGEAASREALSRWKDEWTLAAARGSAAAGSGTASEAAPGASGTAIGELATLAGFLNAMEAFARERETWEARESESLRRLETQQESLEKLGTSLARLKEDEERARRAEREWLSRHQVADAEAYAMQVSRARHIEAELSKRRAELDALAAGMDLDAFRRDVRRKLQGLDEEGVPHQGLDEAALQRLKRRRQELRGQQEEAGRLVLELSDRRSGMAGEIRGAFGKLAGQIVECEDKLAAAEAVIRRLEADKKAAALVLEIFQEIGAGADLLLAGLAREMETMLALILPAGRAVSLSGLDDKQIQVEDAGGGKRSLDQLSTGTKHAMVLAAKLAMALKHRQGPGILVLDEPFLAMDGERETKALELLRDFHERHGWQIILLTKEAALKAKAEGIFTVPRILDLTLYP